MVHTANLYLPTGFKLDKTIVAAGPDSLKVYDNKPKDVQFIKNIAREKTRLNGAPILYFPIDPNSINSTTMLDFDNTLKDHTDLVLGKPLAMIATWTPQEYQLDLSKWGVMMPSGSDQQLFIHVDEISEILGRKPLIGDIIEIKLNLAKLYVRLENWHAAIEIYDRVFQQQPTQHEDIHYDYIQSLLNRNHYSNEHGHGDIVEALDRLGNLDQIQDGTKEPYYLLVLQGLHH